MKRVLLFSILITLFIIIGCNKDDLSVDDPQKAILGKWQITHLGNGSNPPKYDGTGSFSEYLPDGTIRIQNKGENDFIYSKYWFQDSLLMQESTYIDAIDKDTIVFIEPYKYKFLDRNRLVLDWQTLAIFTTSIYKRID